MKRKSEYFPPFKDEGEFMASLGQAHLIKYLVGKLVLKGGIERRRECCQGMDFSFLASGGGEGALITDKRTDQPVSHRLYEVVVRILCLSTSINCGIERTD